MTSDHPFDPGPVAARSAEDGRRRSIPAIEKAVLVLDVVAASARPVTFRELATLVDLPRSSLHDVCSSLINTHLLERTAGGAYRLGVRMTELARSYLSSSDLVVAFREALASVGDPLETAALSVLAGFDTVPISTVWGRAPLGLRVEIGRLASGPYGAAGKAIYSTMSALQLDVLLPERYESPVRAGLWKTRAELDAEVEAGRAHGFWISDEELARGIVCVGAPVLSIEQGPAVAAISVCFIKGAANWFDPGIGDYVRELAAETSRRLGLPHTT